MKTACAVTEIKYAGRHWQAREETDGGAVLLGPRPRDTVMGGRGLEGWGCWYKCLVEYIKRDRRIHRARRGPPSRRRWR